MKEMIEFVAKLAKGLDSVTYSGKELRTEAIGVLALTVAKEAQRFYEYANHVPNFDKRIMRCETPAEFIYEFNHLDYNGLFKDFYSVIDYALDYLKEYVSNKNNEGKEVEENGESN